MIKKTIYALTATLALMVVAIACFFVSCEPEEEFSGYREELHARWKRYKITLYVPHDPAPCFARYMLTPSGRNKPDKADSDKADSADGNIDQSAE
jgi:hypothetical protein